MAAATGVLPNYSMIIPNCEAVYYEIKGLPTSTNVDKHLNDQHFELTNIIQTPLYVSCPEDSVIMELSESSPSAALNAEYGSPDYWQIREDTAPRKDENTLSAQSVSGASGLDVLGVIHSVSSDGQTSTIKGTSSALPDTAMLKVISAARTCIRTDYLSFLETNLPRWLSGGITQCHRTERQAFTNMKTCRRHICASVS